MTSKLTTTNVPVEAERSMGRPKTTKARVPLSAVEVAQKRQQLQIVSLFGGIDYDASYDHKVQRQRVRAAPAYGA